MTFYLRDMWRRKLFTALCRRYNLRPYRRYRQKYTTVVVKAPESFINEILWPEYEEINKVLVKYLDDTTDQIIREEIHETVEEAEVIADHLQLEDHSYKKPEPIEERKSDDQKLQATLQQMNLAKIPRNAPCPCGSGKKYKKCCIKKAQIKQFAS